MARQRWSYAKAQEGWYKDNMAQRGKLVPYDPFNGREFTFKDSVVRVGPKDAVKNLAPIRTWNFKKKIIGGPQVPNKYQIVAGRDGRNWEGKPSPDFWITVRAKWEATPRTMRNNNDASFIALIRREAKRRQPKMAVVSKPKPKPKPKSEYKPKPKSEYKPMPRPEKRPVASMKGQAAPGLSREVAKEVEQSIPQKMSKNQAAKAVGLDPNKDRDTINLYEDVMWGVKRRRDIPAGMKTKYRSYRAKRQEAQKPLQYN